MIKAYELRIGNWLHNSDQGTGMINIVTSHVLQLIEAGAENYLTIQLTPEILESGCFEYSAGVWTGVEPPSHILEIKFIFKSKIPIIRLKHFGLNWCSRIKQVHQLQNIYLDLTGKELKLTL